MCFTGADEGGGGGGGGPVLNEDDGEAARGIISPKRNAAVRLMAFFMFPPRSTFPSLQQNKKKN